MTEDMATYEAALKEMRRDCDTCARPRPGIQVCPMPKLDIDTCLGNASRPFWRPHPVSGTVSLDGDNEAMASSTRRIVPFAEMFAGSSSRPRENDVPCSRCDTCAYGRGACTVEYGSCRQNDFMWWRPKPGAPLSDNQDLIREECDSVRELLLKKNRKYGDSAINPVRIFSKADPLAQIDVRMDDKLSRIRSAQDDDTEDPELDLIGYLILKRVAKRKASQGGPEGR